MPRPSTTGLLKEIISDDIELVYVHITNKAVEWTIAGFIDEAINLLEQLWEFNIPHSEHLWLPDEGLQMIWDVAKKKPKNIPFVFKNLIEIDASSWSRNFYLCGDEESIERVLSKPIKDLNPADAYHKAIITGNNSDENAKDILEALEKYVKLEKPVGSTLAHSTLCGIFLAAKYNRSDYVSYFIKSWGEGYLKYWGNYMLAETMRNKESAKYFLKGDLAYVFKLSHKLIESETKEIIETLSNRMLKGRTLVYKNLSWKRLLDKMSKIAIKQKTTDFSKEILAKKTLSKPSATDAEISATEKRLNLVLPDDYKQFLLTSNGFESFSSTGVTLAPIDQVDFLEKVDEELVDIWADNMDEFDTTFGAKLRSSLIIGGLQEEQQLLLIPKQDGNWECWHFSSWRPGEVVYEEVRIPAGTNVNTTFRIRDRGFPVMHGGKGDQICVAHLVVPKKMTDKQKELLREFAELSDHAPQEVPRGFFDRVKDVLGVE